MWIEINEYVFKDDNNYISKKGVIMVNTEIISYIRFYYRGVNDTNYYKIVLNDKNFSQFIIDESDYDWIKLLLTGKNS